MRDEDTTMPPRGTSSAAEADAELAGLMALRVWKYKEGEVVSLMIHLGDRLGLYRAMDGAGPLTAAELARRTGLQERWLLEWLRGQAAAELVDTVDGEVFTLSPEAAAVLSDEEGSLLFAGGAFTGGVLPPQVIDRLVDAFRTGRGLTYDDLGGDAAVAVERMLGPWSRLAVVPSLVPRLDGVHAKLTAGARVLDVGCGTGLALRAVAEAFPESSFEGIDPSAEAIERARTETEAAGLANVAVRQASAHELPDGPAYDLVLTFDCLHDMARPLEAAQSVRRVVADDGTWLIKEVKSAGSWEGNLRNPVLALMYGNSVTTCMSCGLSEEGGAGLGTLGLPPDRLERMCREAGFTGSFTTHDIGDPANLYHEVRP